MFSVSRLRDGGTFLINVGTLAPRGRVDLLLGDTEAVLDWCRRWLDNPEDCIREMQQLIQGMTEEERVAAE